MQLHPEVLKYKSFQTCGLIISGLNELKMLIPIPMLPSAHMMPPVTSPQKRMEVLDEEEKADDEPKRIHSSETTVIDGVVRDGESCEVNKIGL
jgi:hypothetical protein